MSPEKAPPSISAWTLLAASLAEGPSRLFAFTHDATTEPLINALRNLGVTIRDDRHAGTVTVIGIGGRWRTGEWTFTVDRFDVLAMLMAATAAGQGDYTFEPGPGFEPDPAQLSLLINRLRDLGTGIGEPGHGHAGPITLRAQGLTGSVLRLPREPAPHPTTPAVLMLIAARARSDVFMEWPVESARPVPLDLVERVASRLGISMIRRDNGRCIIPAPQLSRGTDLDLYRLAHE